MPTVKQGFLDLEHRYLFQETARRVAAYREAHPEADLIPLGIGDVTRPLAPAVIDALHAAVEDLACAERFVGYGPEQGHLWLREAIASGDYAARGVRVEPDEIFVNDGAKSDLGNISDLFAPDNRVGITDPVYPVYLDTNVIDSRRVSFIPCTEENGFTGEIPTEHLDLVYLCYPNNPTGAVITREKLAAWVRYALENDAFILYDSAYEAYIRDPELPHSIYEIEGARDCALEFRSFSKTAGFTGLRCGYTVVPRELSIRGRDGQRVSLNWLWDRRQGCKFNGASYLSQRGALALYSETGRRQARESVQAYLDTAALIRAGLGRAGVKAYGGENAPYVWAQAPDGMDSWDFFDFLLREAGVVVTPGSGFGRNGEGWFRITSFTDRERTAEAMERMEHCMHGR